MILKNEKRKKKGPLWGKKKRGEGEEEMSNRKKVPSFVIRGSDQIYKTSREKMITKITFRLRK